MSTAANPTLQDIVGRYRDAEAQADRPRNTDDDY